MRERAREITDDESGSFRLPVVFREEEKKLWQVEGQKVIDVDESG